MSGVIKSSDRGGGIHVRELALEPPVPVLTAEMQRILELERRLTQADGLIQSLQDEVARLETVARDSWKDGHAVGVTEGRQAAEDQSAALLKRLMETSEEASRNFLNGLAALETAAAGLASIALGRIVDDAEERQSLVVSAVRRTLNQLFADSLVAVEVSRADFPDATALRMLMLPDGVKLHASGALPSGGCRVRLRLGEIDLGLDDQVARLRTLLNTGIGAAG